MPKKTKVQVQLICLIVAIILVATFSNIFAQVVPTNQLTSLWLRASAYINWGQTRGSSGYGIRDNAGSMEAKNSGGSWVAIAPSGGAAPDDAPYITQIANATLSNEQAMGALASGLVTNATTTGVQSIYAGTSCTNQFPRSLSTAGAATCATVASTDVNNTIALTGTDINTSNQVTVTHLAAALPFAQGGFGFTTATTGDIFYASGSNTPGKLADVATGSILTSGGIGVAPAWTAAAYTVGVAAGYKIARGSTAFDASNPTTVATGLSTVVSCTATMIRSTALSTGTAFVTHAAPSGANVDFYAWVIAGTASTGTENFDWVCVGT